jgi:phenylpyruvate tautomerase PptA (4-oxalocrotonate tautomerase family)
VAKHTADFKCAVCKTNIHVTFEDVTPEEFGVAALQTTNTDYTKCAQDLIAKVMSRCNESAISVIAEYLRAHFA